MSDLLARLHLSNIPLTQAEKTALARDLLQFATPEDWLRVATECLLHLDAAATISPRRLVPLSVARDVFDAIDMLRRAVQYLDESKAREAGGS